MNVSFKHLKQFPAYAMLIAFVLLFHPATSAQSVDYLQFTYEEGLGITDYSLLGEDPLPVNDTLPLFSVLFDDSLYTTLDAEVSPADSGYLLDFSNGMQCKVNIILNYRRGWKAVVRFKNTSEKDTIKVLNLVPLGESEEHVYITASEPWNLASSKLFRPGVGPIGVVLPDNAWSMGYGSHIIHDHTTLAGISRRGKAYNADRKRYPVYLFPDGTVSYELYIDEFEGKWHKGLELFFRERYLYDLDYFDNALYEREDLKWIRHSYVIAMQYAWDHNFYDRFKAQYQFKEFLEEAEKDFGGYDVYTLWPTWPTLGLDQRNQWDLYEDLPGGLEKISQLADYSRSKGTKFFISYNPWDQSTRNEDHIKGMVRLLKDIGADGVVLDTKGESSNELQAAADSVDEGIIMYSEGMAVPKNMPGIVSGRVHDAIYLPPPLNLNKYMKPDFAFFRVLQLVDGWLYRDIALSLFNGYGVEINTFGAGRPERMKQELKYLGEVVRILRQNKSVFVSQKWEPLLPTLKDSIWVNKWITDNKIAYTVFSLLPEGHDGALFEWAVPSGFHLVDVMKHEEIDFAEKDGKRYAQVTIDGFSESWLGTRREGKAACLVILKDVISVSERGGVLDILFPQGDSLLIWNGNPAYDKVPVKLETGKHKVDLYKHFFRYEGKFVLQAFENGELLDEKVIRVELGTPRLITSVEKTEPAVDTPDNMTLVEGGMFFFTERERWSFLSYPVRTDEYYTFMDSFYIDIYPVTNADYKEFLDEAGYQPKDTTNFLRHWENGTYPEGKGDYPVVYVSYEDANAYAEWAGKRLPTEYEWQFSGQGYDTLSYPWGTEFDEDNCNNALGHPTPVDEYPGGESRFGVRDMVGNVWQLTNDVYDNGSYYFVIIKGGSYYKPTSSWWYVEGGPVPLNQRQMLLMVSPGFERNATVGFRCVKDIQ